jgi:puromycin-sensitive aminopeptidase
VLVNEGGHGFYRVRYERGLLDALLGDLGGLAAIERYNLVNDAWACVMAGMTPLTDYLDLTARFRGERDRNVWSVIVGSLSYLNRIVEDEDRPRLQRLVRDRLGPAVAELGWAPHPEEDELTGQLRSDLLRATGILGDDPATQAAAARVFGRAHGESEIEHRTDANVTAAAVAILAHAGDAARYDDFLSRFRAAKTPQEEQRFLLALANFRPPALVERSLGLVLDGGVRTQDAPFLLRSLLMAPHSRGRAWEYFRANWERLSATLPGPGVRRLCEGVIGLATAEWEREVNAFFLLKNVTLGGKTLEQFLEQLRVAVVLREREAAALRGHLRGVG